MPEYTPFSTEKNYVRELLAVAEVDAAVVYTQKHLRTSQTKDKTAEILEFLESLQKKDRQSKRRSVEDSKVSKFLALVEKDAKESGDEAKREWYEYEFRRSVARALLLDIVSKRVGYLFDDYYYLFLKVPQRTKLSREQVEKAKPAVLRFVRKNAGLIADLVQVKFEKNRQNNLRMKLTRLVELLRYLQGKDLTVDQPGLRSNVNELIRMEKDFAVAFQKMTVATLILRDEDERALMATFGPRALDYFQGETPWKNFFAGFLKPKTEEYFHDMQVVKEYEVEFRRGALKINYPLERVYNGLGKEAVKDPKTDVHDIFTQTIDDKKGVLRGVSTALSKMSMWATRTINSPVQMYELLTRIAVLIPDTEALVAPIPRLEKKLRQLKETFNTKRFGKSKVQSDIALHARMIDKIEYRLQNVLSVVDHAVYAYERYFDAAVMEHFDFLAEYVKKDADKASVKVVSRGSERVELIRELNMTYSYKVRKMMLENMTALHFYKLVRDQKTLKDNNSWERVSPPPRFDEVKNASVEIMVDVYSLLVNDFPNIMQVPVSGEEREIVLELQEKQKVMIAFHIFQKSIEYIAPNWRKELASIGADQFKKRYLDLFTKLTDPAVYNHLQVPIEGVSRMEKQQYLQKLVDTYMAAISKRATAA